MKILIAAVVMLVSGSAVAGVGELAAVAGDFVEGLSEEHREAVVYDLKDDARATWSNLPTVMSPPAGVMLGELSDDQRHLVHLMFQLSMSSQGYAKAHGIMWLDDILRDIEQANLTGGDDDDPIRVLMADTRSSGNYAIAVFGTPGETRWGWKVTGHHLAVNVSVIDGQIALTPGFYGSNPRIIQAGPYAGFAPLAAESRLGLEFLGDLTEAQRKKAIIGDERPQDVIEGPGRRGSLEKFEGISSKELNDAQLGALQRLVGEYVRNAKPKTAGEHLDAIAGAGWENVWFSWRGPADGSAEYYYRVHGPRILIEYNLQNPNHDHAVVRDPVNDYGEDWLGHHYTEVHPSNEEAFARLRELTGS